MRSNCPPKALLHAAYGILFAATLVMPPSPRLDIMERQQAYSIMISNAYAVKDAAECTAEVFIQNSPEYGRVYGVIGDLTEHLPGGRLLLNPLTGARTEPSGADATGTDGSVGYAPINMGGINVGYSINAAGRHGSVIYTIWHILSTPSSPDGTAERATKSGESHASPN